MGTNNRTLRPRLDFNTVTQDPEFLALEFAEQRKVLLDIDSDFSGLPVGEQFKVRNNITASMGLQRLNSNRAGLPVGHDSSPGLGP